VTRTPRARITVLRFEAKPKFGSDEVKQSGLASIIYKTDSLFKKTTKLLKEHFFGSFSTV
jgi:hypothetical protein